MPTLADHANHLQANVATLSTRDQAFALSLLAAYRSPRGASAAQAMWIERLAARVVLPGTLPTQSKLEGEGFARLAALFTRAREHLKRPRIDVTVSEIALTLSLAKEGGRNPGFVYVKSAGAYMGKVSPTGEYTPGRDATPAVTAAVSTFSANPAAAAKAHGDLTGNCCFCRLPLTDARSTAVGYGRTCAGNYGLPWGDAKSDVSPVFAPATPA